MIQKDSFQKRENMTNLVKRDIFQMVQSDIDIPKMVLKVKQDNIINMDNTGITKLEVLK